MTLKERMDKAESVFDKSDHFLVLGIEENEIMLRSSGNDHEICTAVAGLVRKDKRFRQIIEFALLSEHQTAQLRIED